MTEPLVRRWIELSQIRAWVAEQLSAETDGEVRDSLFEARHTIGFAMLHLERVDYRCGNTFNSVDQSQSPA
jgi:hypothetical protein